MTAVTASHAAEAVTSNPPRHSAALRALHWTIAVLIFAAIAVGVYAIYMPRSPARVELMTIHKSIGVTVLALVVVRILVRLAASAPAYLPPLDAFTRFASTLGHLALYALMLAMPISGYIHSSAGQHAFNWFGLFPVPMLVGDNPQIDHATGLAHYVFAWTIGAVLTIHILAALWHLIVKKDNVFARMWPSRSGA